MKYFITIVIAACSLNVFSQGTPQLPWNPDENGDGFIGVSDLQGLLSQYGLDFNAAILSEDGENAIVDLGDLPYPICASSCRNLPGFWSVASLEDLGLVWPLPSNTYHIWLNSSGTNLNPKLLYYSQSTWYINEQMYSSARCYCAAHEMPKVEYSYCEGSSIQVCAENKVTNGWFPLGGISTSYVTLSSSHIETQAFWRWAE
jgi:hypothetical protein